MSIIGWYYLHENGSLIYKRELGDTAADIRESSFARAMWPLNPQDREGAWNILVESLSLGADKARVDELAALWHCNDDDADNYAQAVDCYIDLEGNKWCAKPMWFVNLQESPAGFGDTKLEALAELCKELGYKGGKTWNATFKTLLKSEEDRERERRDHGQFGVGA